MKPKKSNPNPTNRGKKSDHLATKIDVKTKPTIISRAPATILKHLTYENLCRKGIKPFFHKCGKRCLLKIDKT
jgi:hypothetical protein